MPVAHPPSDAANLPTVPADRLQAWREGAEAVAAVRATRADPSLARRKRSMKGLHAGVGWRPRRIPHAPARRRSGRGSFSWRRLARLACTGNTAFWNVPLRPRRGIGALIALLALGHAGPLSPP